MKTLGEFIVEKQHEFSHATGELTALLSAIKLAPRSSTAISTRPVWSISWVPAVLKTFRARFSKNSICSLMKN
ncbi:Fructose-1,6-bisphosphatase [Klebsiella pneumoniae]|uniref:Fructose-1,6-bisphosphatase n=1 Tax=Klebsiella pneumoniae TaxID=573 RepID=A0A2X3EB87_KLEPN|nr:Fructose-1,6-bisphosphatase [Klebsiella pneumoniae]